jgi:spermidine dehydrogenase
MHLDPGSAPNMSYSAAGYANGGSYEYHFPDGNASIARLLVRNLLPEAVPGHTVEDVVTANVDYGRLDQPASPIRLRLQSTVVAAKNLGGTDAQEVEVTYTQRKRVFKVHAKSCVLACWNMMIPYLCPELPDKQKEALHYLVKVPLVYGTVAIRNWKAFQKIGIQHVNTPGSYWDSVSLNSSTDIGDYHSPKSPDEPILLHLSRTPADRASPLAINTKPAAWNFWSRHSKTSNARRGTSLRAFSRPAASTRRKTFKPSPSIAGRTDTDTNTTPCLTRTGLSPSVPM